MSALLLRSVRVEGRVVDVRVASGRVVAVGAGSQLRPGDEVLDGRGGALIPGLHDHHVHLLATAAAERSVRVGPPEVTTAEGLVAALREADRALPPGAWLRAVGQHESVGGDLDRRALDAIVATRPVRVQHRSGMRWTLNSAGCRAVGLGQDTAGAEVDPRGEPTGRLLRGDAWLRDRLPDEGPPRLEALGRRLARLGVTGVTDATPFTDPGDLALLAGLPQRVMATGGPELTAAAFPEGIGRGPVKIVLDDHDLPALDLLAARIGGAHGAGRCVAVHCVSRVSLILALAAWEVAGRRKGDRIEHGSVVPEVLIERLRGLTVVTNPGFVGERGDRYLAEVEPAEHDDLYRCGSLLDAGVAVAGGTDAPYGSCDPWRAIGTAIDRRTAQGTLLGARERVAPARALDLFLGPPDEPGGPPRRVVPGAIADLVLLAAPLDEVLASPTAEAVRQVFIGGRPV